MSSNSKNYFCCIVDGIFSRGPVLSNAAMTLTLRSSDPQSESVTEFPLLSSYKRLESRLEVSSDSKNHFGFLVEEMSEPGLTINSQCY